jgi:hypothetical protein
VALARVQEARGGRVGRLGVAAGHWKGSKERERGL